MTDSNEINSFRCTMRWEGRAAKSMSRSDPGNWTSGKVGQGQLIGSKFGVSAPVLLREFPGVKMDDVTEAMALQIHRKSYWLPIHADKMLTGLDHAVADDAYNAGVGAASRRYAALRNIRSADTFAAIHDYTGIRLSFLHGLRLWATYGRGWTRRVAGVEAEAVQMAHAEAVNTKPSASQLNPLPSLPVMFAAKADAVAQKHAATTEGAALSTALVATAPAAVSSFASAPYAAVLHHPLILSTIAAAGIVLLAFMLYHHHIGAIRAAVLRGAADEHSA